MMVTKLWESHISVLLNRQFSPATQWSISCETDSNTELSTLQKFNLTFISSHDRLCNSYTLRYRCFWVRNPDGRRPEGFLIQKHRIPKCITNLHPRFFVKHPSLKYNILKLSFFYLYEVFNQQLKNTTNYILWKTL